jgi:hypothetical protein
MSNASFQCGKGVHQQHVRFEQTYNPMSMAFTQAAGGLMDKERDRGGCRTQIEAVSPALSLGKEGVRLGGWRRHRHAEWR